MTWKDWKGADKREYDRDYKTIYPKTPDHPFFKTHRWYSVLIADEPDDRHYEGRSFEIVGSSLKAYELVIEKFVDWILPYLEPQDEPFLIAVEEGEGWGKPANRYFTDGRAEHCVIDGEKGDSPWIGSK
jgi:hypothetical protein